MPTTLTDVLNEGSELVMSVDNADETLISLKKIVQLSGATQMWRGVDVFQRITKEFLDRVTGNNVPSNRLIHGGIYLMESRGHLDPVQFVGVGKQKPNASSFDVFSSRPIAVKDLEKGCYYVLTTSKSDCKDVYQFGAYAYNGRLAIGSSADRVSFRAFVGDTEELESFLGSLKLDVSIVSACLDKESNMTATLSIKFPDHLKDVSADDLAETRRKLAAIVKRIVKRVNDEPLWRAEDIDLEDSTKVSVSDDSIEVIGSMKEIGAVLEQQTIDKLSRYTKEDAERDAKVATCRWMQHAGFLPRESATSIS